ncbi:hypothetical protein [Metamycoplasma hominis]|jgi:hypothetical protein|uniref:hypothetical protein n=1 Tax=Metamycoplasma hominis TaxID=2098 RepID=UPI00193A97FE|nr:hypothetical protein [Metamycoplasma hominis]MDU7418801.1 hypothetical protein [Metamycoplasma hominis]
MIIEEKNMIIKLRADGLGYGQIASQLGLNKSTLSSFFKGKVRKKIREVPRLL